MRTDIQEHLAAHRRALGLIDESTWRIQSWGTQLSHALLDGRRLLACGNGGSAAEAEHLVAELVGRFRTERAALSALALTSDGSCVTAIANDYGWKHGLARQVQAHGRPGDVLIALSTSGRSENVIAAARAGREVGMRVWGLTGAAPNPLVRSCDDALSLPGETAVVQELHLVVIHLLCGIVDTAAASCARRAFPEAG